MSAIARLRAGLLSSERIRSLGAARCGLSSSRSVRPVLEETVYGAISLHQHQGSLRRSERDPNTVHVSPENWTRRRLILRAEECASVGGGPG